MHFLGTLGLIGCFLMSSKLWDEHPNGVFLLVAFGPFGFVLLAVALLEESSASTIPLSYLRSIAAETRALLTIGISAIPFAGAMAVGLAYMLDLVPRNRTAEFVGFSVISVAVAQIVGPLIAWKLIDTIGYRSIFPAAAASMIVGLIILQFVSARPRRSGA